MAAIPPICDFDWPAPDFELLATNGQTYNPGQLRGPSGMLLMFICNHCPYVLAVLDRMVRDARDLQALGVGVAAICSNDPVAYPADGFDRMKDMARIHQFPFPYLHDADQTVARAYDAVCTPDFFGFNSGLELQYRGRLDASRRKAAPDGTKRDLFDAMTLVADTDQGPRNQVASMGCSIKWKPQ